MNLWKKLGLLKWRIFDDLPYHGLSRRGALQRLNLKDQVKNLPSLPACRSTGPEVHMLCGKNQIDMAIWASWSLLRFMKGSSLIVHSDGSLLEQDIQLWRRIVPNFTQISREESDRKATDVLSDRFPLLLEWRERQFYGSKFIDFHFFGANDRLITLDSDVLFFEAPDELVSGLSQQDSPFRWHEDIRTSYLASVVNLESCLGDRVAEQVNSGCLLTKRWDDNDLEFFEGILGRMHSLSLPIYHNWAEQTMYAISASRHRVASVLPKEYSIYFGKTLDSSVMRHYTGVSKLRPRFYLEGIPRLLKQVSDGKQSGSSIL